MSTAWQLTDSETFELHTIRPQLTDYFKRRISRDEIENFATDTMIAAGTRFERRSSLHHFVFSIARRKVAQYWRVKKHRAGRGELLPIEGEHVPAFEAIPGPGPGPESVFSIHTRQILLHDALAEVPEVYRDVVAMWLEGHDNVEIAAVLGIKYNTARSRLARGKGLLLAAYDAALDEGR